jgi:hypothetical protein
MLFIGFLDFFSFLGLLESMASSSINLFESEIVLIIFISHQHVEFLSEAFLILVHSLGVNFGEFVQSGDDGFFRGLFLEVF